MIIIINIIIIVYPKEQIRLFIFRRRANLSTHGWFSRCSTSAARAPPPRPPPGTTWQSSNNNYYYITFYYIILCYSIVYHVISSCIILQYITSIRVSKAPAGKVPAIRVVSFSSRSIEWVCAHALTWIYIYIYVYIYIYIYNILF